jgi:hypothetical protein
VSRAVHTNAARWRFWQKPDALFRFEGIVAAACGTAILALVQLVILILGARPARISEEEMSYE